MSIRLANEASIDWMHPSWRDLVIEELATDSAAREHFLKNCGPPGFLLALSVAGGATGGRVMPLLCSAKDWAALSDAVPRVLGFSQGASTKVLATLYAALSASPKLHATTSPMGRFADHVLSVLRELWANNHLQPTASEVERYYMISQVLDPLPPGPILKLIWTRSWNACNKQLANFETDERWPALNEIQNWLHLVQVIIENEPRFARQIELPAEFTEFAKNLLGKATVRGEAALDLEDPEYCTIEEGQLVVLHTIAQQIGTAFRSLKVTAKEAARKIWQNSMRVEELRRQMEEEARENDDGDVYDDSSEGDEAESEERTILDEYVNIDRLFADL